MGKSLIPLRLMTDAYLRPCQIIEFPGPRRHSAPWRGGSPLFEKLDGYILDELTPLIGFTRGAAALYAAGIEYVGHLVAKSQQDLASIDGIGPRKIARINEYLADRRLALGSPCEAWFDHYRGYLLAMNTAQVQRLHPTPSCAPA